MIHLLLYLCSFKTKLYQKPDPSVCLGQMHLISMIIKKLLCGYGLCYLTVNICFVQKIFAYLEQTEKVGLPKLLNVLNSKNPSDLPGKQTRIDFYDLLSCFTVAHRKGENSTERFETT